MIFSKAMWRSYSRYRDCANLASKPFGHSQLMWFSDCAGGTVMAFSPRIPWPELSTALLLASPVSAACTVLPAGLSVRFSALELFL